MSNVVNSPVLTLGLLLAAVGCNTPDAANITLRKQNQQLQQQVDDLTAQHARDGATLAAEVRDRPTVPSLPQDRLDRLVTVQGLQFGRLTGGDNPNSVIGPDTLLDVYVVPVDGQGTAVKAAGAFTVEAFDLARRSGPPLVGTWQFPLARSRDLFFDRLGQYTYVLPCPWQTIPPHPDLTVRVTFDDELTGRRFVAQTQAKAHPPAATQP